ncbi:hypothetical protein [Pseudomonas sp. MUP55]|uniref:hypothetical protein n=1 Tax=Pseudomonas sp. MUP55 TaxID=3087234 RepID=UPI002A5A6D2C|nr:MULTISPECIES: hypothetical protein [unclassified Pseudomonas]WPN90651.1 hypothetical protein SC319_15425 [Pseudomonas sp. MUP56]WPN96176.1 hypothetical protein SC318_15430 [Pseudomonas sp. MUP55]
MRVTATATGGARYELFDKCEQECRKVILVPGNSDRPLTEPLEELSPEIRLQGVPGF